MATSIFIHDIEHQLHHDIERLRFEIEVTSLYDIFFQHHNDVVAINVAQCKTPGYSDTNFQCRIDTR